MGEERCLTYSHQYPGYTSGCYVSPATLYSYVQHIYRAVCVVPFLWGRVAYLLSYFGLSKHPTHSTLQIG